MMPEKPSSNEEEYFHKLEREKIEKRRQEAALKRAEEEREQRKQLHFMRCPKCGAALAEETYHGIKVDRCGECQGVWFDAGEIESLIDQPEDKAGAFLRNFAQGMLGGRKKKAP
jgi:hypothetical protein